MIKKHKDVGTNHFDDSNVFIECSNSLDDVYQNIDDYNPSTQRKILIVFDDMIAGIMRNKNFQAIIKELLHLFLSLSLIFLFQKMLD